MLWISFGWTTPAMHAQQKNCTRRNWARRYAAMFDAGQVCIWADTVSFADEKPQGRIRLLEKPYQESTADISESDWEAEGFAYLASIGADVDGQLPRQFWDNWKANPVTLWVVRFAFVEVKTQLELFHAAQ